MKEPEPPVTRAALQEDSLQLVGTLHDVAGFAARELKRRLKSPKQRKSLKVSELNFIFGTSVDKISRYERWERTDSGDAGEFVKNLVAGIQSIAGHEVTLTVEKLPERVETNVVEADYIVDGPVHGTLAMRNPNRPMSILAKRAEANGLPYASRIPRDAPPIELEPEE